MHMKNPNIMLGKVIGTGSLLFAVAVKGSEDWDGSALWLAAGDSVGAAQDAVTAQYDPEDFDDSADWTFEQIGDFV